MAVVQIPNLPVAISLVGNEQLEIVQAGTSCRTTVLQVAQFASNPFPPTSYATTYQFLNALANSPGIDVNLLYQNLNPDFSSQATMQFYTSPYVRQGSPLYILAQSVYPLLDMNQVYADAMFYPQWG